MKQNLNFDPHDPLYQIRTGRGFRWAFSVLLRGAKAIARWRRRRSSLRALRQLDDRTLKDIGLTRGDLHSVAEYYANDKIYPRRPETIRPQRRD